MAKIKAIITPDQEKAFNKVVNAIKAANRTGLVFFGKQNSLVAYTKDAADYENLHGIDRLTTNYNSERGEIPHIGAPILADSGADDYSYFLNGDEAI